MKKYLLTSMAFVPFALLTSCATLINGPTQNICITSEPSNAKVCVDNEFRGYTPITLGMSRSCAHTVHLELPGYKPYSMHFERRISKWVAGNIVFGGVIGLVIDAVTGSIYKLTPSQMHAVLQENNVAYSRRTKHGAVAVVLEADPTWKKVGQLEAI